jgi:hypothetical protein
MESNIWLLLALVLICVNCSEVLFFVICANNFVSIPNSILSLRLSIISLSSGSRLLISKNVFWKLRITSKWCFSLLMILLIFLFLFSSEDQGFLDNSVETNESQISGVIILGNSFLSSYFLNSVLKLFIIFENCCY